MRLKENLNIRKIGNEYFIVSESSKGVDYTRVITLNGSASYLIEKVQSKDFTKEDWVKLLVERYEVSVERATEDAQNLIDTLVQAGVIV